MISAIILAAGLSRRMGRPKLLLKLGQKTIVEKVVDTVLASKVDEVIVVLGAYQEEISSLLVNRPVKLVFNPGFSEGQGSSVASGAREAHRDAEALMFLLGDQPLISVDIINQLIKVWQQRKPKLVRPLFGSLPGNPCLFSASLRTELTGLSGDSGGRTIIEKYRRHLITVPFDCEVMGMDIDTSDDYERLNAIWKQMEDSVCSKSQEKKFSHQ